MTTTTQHQSSREDQLEAIREQLEERYEFHTGQLRDLMAVEEDPGAASMNAALRSQSRQALSEIAGALQHMAEGRYGRCLDCAGDIPTERLQVRPDAVFCTPCQAQRDRGSSRRSPAA